jgi:tetratricopeptide (TPR) repeat protein
MNEESTANIESLKPTIVLVLDNLEELYRAQGQYAKAKPLYHRALAILEKRAAWAWDYRSAVLLSKVMVEGSGPC